MWIVPVVIVAVVAVGVIATNVVMRRKGYSIPGRTVVRCSKGHRFVTTWIEGGSLKAVRLGPVTRYQRCPVGNHWAIVHPVKDADLTEEDSRAAGRVALTTTLRELLGSSRSEAPRPRTTSADRSTRTPR